MRRLSLPLILVVLLASACKSAPVGISGKVTDDAGNPLPGVLMQVAFCDSDSQCQAVDKTLTLADGTYTLITIPPGEYILGALWKTRTNCGYAGFDSFQTYEEFLIMYGADRSSGNTTAIATLEVTYQEGDALQYDLELSCPAAEDAQDITVPAGLGDGFPLAGETSADPSVEVLTAEADPPAAEGAEAAILTDCSTHDCDQRHVRSPGRAAVHSLGRPVSA